MGCARRQRELSISMRSKSQSSAPEAINMLFRADNIGKLIVELYPPSPTPPSWNPEGSPLLQQSQFLLVIHRLPRD